MKTLCVLVGKYLQLLKSRYHIAVKSLIKLEGTDILCKLQTSLHN